MSESLENTKERLRQEYLGKAGIHAIGLGRGEGAIRVYVGPDSGGKQAEVLERLRESAAPFPVIVIAEDKPRIA